MISSVHQLLLECNLQVIQNTSCNSWDKLSKWDWLLWVLIKIGVRIGIKTLIDTGAYLGCGNWYS